MIDRIAYSSKLRYKSPCLKAFFAIFTLFMCVFDRSIVLSSIILILMGNLIVKNTKVSFHDYMHLIFVPVLFVLLSTIPIIVNISEVPLSDFFIPMFSKYLVISSSGLLKGITLMLTALSCVSCLYFLSLTTPMIDILSVLKAIHCPLIIIELFLLIYRLIFIILNYANSISISQKCRLGNKNFKTSLNAMANMLSVLLILSIKRSSALYDAMESRCYDGEINVIQETNKAEKYEIAKVIAIEFILLAICLVKWWCKL